MVADRGRRTRRSRRSHLTAGGWKATALRGRRLGNNIHMPLNINLLHARKHNSQVRSLCHLLPSSHVRYLATYSVTFLHVRSVAAKHVVMVIVGPFMVLVCLSILYMAFLAFSFHSFPKHHIIPRSSLITCPEDHKTLPGSLQHCKRE